MNEKVIAIFGNLLGWSGAMIATAGGVEALVGIFAGASAGVASLATAAYFICKLLRERRSSCETRPLKYGSKKE